MITKDIWSALTEKEKENRVIDCLEQLCTIQEGKHKLSGTRDQGRLSSVKKDLEAFIINAAQWSSDKQVQQKKPLINHYANVR